MRGGPDKSLDLQHDDRLMNGRAGDLKPILQDRVAEMLAQREDSKGSWCK